MSNLLTRLWPFVLRSEHERVRQENWHLRSAIRAANEELLKHRNLLAGLRTGQTDICRAVEKVFQP